MPTAVKQEKEDNTFKRSNSSLNFKKLVPKVLRSSSMKNPFKSKKPRTPVDIVRETRALLLYFHSGDDAGNPKRDEKLEQLDANIRELKSILYGIDESEPVPEACAQLTQEFFKEDTMRLLINCLPKLNFEARKDASRVIANLQRQPVHSRLIASDYLEANLDIMDQLITGYVLKPEHVKKFFDYIQLPNFDVASDAAATFKLLGDILLDRSNAGSMIRYVSSKDNMRLMTEGIAQRKLHAMFNFQVYKRLLSSVSSSSLVYPALCSSSWPTRNKPADIVNMCK
ncbi:UNVERIFIED_CONTAM: putative MO25-like protein [Sesamum radiatum]|uniref:MO25-like protein n=1 Tax=Sesamum radiatum TaxID=300843 RepID=A0AAW2KH52_SESRA